MGNSERDCNGTGSGDDEQYKNEQKRKNLLIKRVFKDLPACLPVVVAASFV